MGLVDLAPDDSEFCVVSHALALVDVSDSLAKVKACVLLLIHSLDLKEGKLLMLGSLSSLEPSEYSFCVQSKIRKNVIRI